MTGRSVGSCTAQAGGESTGEGENAVVVLGPHEFSYV